MATDPFPDTNTEGFGPLYKFNCSCKVIVGRGEHSNRLLITQKSNNAALSGG